MVNIRPYINSDNDKLIEIRLLIPKVNNETTIIDRRPDITSRYIIYNVDDTTKVYILIAEEDINIINKIIGMIGYVIKYYQGKKYASILEVIIHPEFQRKGIGIGLIKKMEEKAKNKECDYICSYAHKDNNKWRFLLEKLGYNKKYKIIINSINIKRKKIKNEKLKIERLTDRDIPEVVNLINNYYLYYKHFVPFTPETFKSKLFMPGYGQYAFWTGKIEKKIIVCAGIWDISIVEKEYYKKLPLRKKIEKLLTGIKKENIEHIEKFYLIDHAFQNKYFDEMTELIKYINNMIHKYEKEYLEVILFEDDPLVEVIKRFDPKIEYANLYIKNLNGENRGDEKWIEDKYYVDVRDFL